MEKENIEILKYNDDFIPDDDTIYSLVFESEIFEKVKKETEKHRRFLMKNWDKYKKEINSSLKELLRFDIDNTYHLLVIHPQLNTIEYINHNPFQERPFQISKSFEFINAVKFKNYEYVIEALQFSKAYLFSFDYYNKNQ